MKLLIKKICEEMNLVVEEINHLTLFIYTKEDADIDTIFHKVEQFQQENTYGYDSHKSESSL